MRLPKLLKYLGGLSLWLGHSLSVWAQSSAEVGLLYLTNYPPKTYQAFHQNWQVVPHPNGLLYVGNGDGVLEYDGETWRLIPVDNQTVVRSMDLGSDGTVYVGATREFGYLRPDAQGRMAYQSLLPLLPDSFPAFPRIFTIKATPEGVFFLCKKHLFRYAHEKLTIWHAPAFRQINYVHGQLLVTDNDQGTRRVVGDSLQPFLPPALLPVTSMRYLLPLEDGEILVCEDKNAFWRFDGAQLEPYENPLSRLLKNSWIINPYQLPSGDFAFATYYKGLIVGSPSGEIKAVVNKQSGLTTDIVFDVRDDWQGGLWLGLDNGLARVELSSPLSNFDARNGLEGPVNDVIRFEGELFAATGLGIYRLSKKRPEAPSARFELLHPELKHQFFHFLALEDELLMGGGGGIYSWKKAQLRKLHPGRASVLHRSPHHPERVYVGLVNGLLVLEKSGDQWINRGLVPGFTDDTRVIEEPRPGELWVGLHDGQILQLQLEVPPSSPLQATLRRYGQTDGLPQGYIALKKIRQQLWFMSGQQGFRFHRALGKFIPDSSLALHLGGSAENINPAFEDPFGNLWFLEKQATDNWPWRRGRLQADSSYVPEIVHTERIEQKADWVLFPEKTRSYGPAEVMGWSG